MRNTPLLIGVVAVVAFALPAAASAQSPPADQYTESEPTATGDKQSQKGGASSGADGGASGSSGSLGSSSELELFKTSDGSSSIGSSGTFGGSSSSPGASDGDGGDDSVSASDTDAFADSGVNDVGEDGQEALLTAGTDNGSSAPLLLILGLVALAALVAAWYGRRRFGRSRG